MVCPVLSALPPPRQHAAKASPGACGDHGALRRAEWGIRVIGYPLANDLRAGTMRAWTEARPPMRRLHEEIHDVRVPSEALAKWALETPVAAQEATCSALAFLVAVEHASTTLLPVPTLLRSEQAVLDPDGFLRQPRGAVEHFRARAHRAMGWMDLFIFFRERFPAAAQRQLPESLFGL